MIKPAKPRGWEVMRDIPDSRYKKENEENTIKAREELQKIGERITVSKGGLLRSTDVHYQDVYFLEEGLCALYMEGLSGKDMALVYFFPGRLINFLPALEKFYPRRMCALCYNMPLAEFFVKALKDSVLLKIRQQDFLERYFKSLPFHALVIQSLVANCYDLFSNMSKTIELPAWQKVARELLENMEGPHPHILPRRITYNEIATHLSIHTVTVAKIFKALQENGIVERLKEGVMIKDPLRIWKIANGEERLFYKNQERKSE